MDETKQPTLGTSTTSTPPSPDALHRMTAAVEASIGGTDCVLCDTADGQMVTTEQYCKDYPGHVLVKYYGPCPVVPPPPPPSPVAGLATQAAPPLADGDIVVCSIQNKEVFTTAENCRAWKGTIVRKAS